MLSNFSSEVFEARMALMRGCAVNRYTSTYLDHGNRLDLLTRWLRNWALNTEYCNFTY
jgi:hypothetical protein